jgi:hypothetical protein
VIYKTGIVAATTFAFGYQNLIHSLSAGCIVDYKSICPFFAASLPVFLQLPANHSVG